MGIIMDYHQTITNIAVILVSSHSRQKNTNAIMINVIIMITFRIITVISVILIVAFAMTFIISHLEKGSPEKFVAPVRTDIGDLTHISVRNGQWKISFLDKWEVITASAKYLDSDKRFVE